MAMAPEAEASRECALSLKVKATVARNDSSSADGSSSTCGDVLCSSTPQASIGTTCLTLSSPWCPGSAGHPVCVLVLGMAVNKWS